MSKKSELYEQYEGVVSLLKDCPTTIVMHNQGYAKGQVYSIHKVTQEQANKSLGGIILFSGTASEAKRYLQGHRDLIIEVLPNRLLDVTLKTVYIIMDEEGAIIGTFKSINKSQMETEIQANLGLSDFVITDIIDSSTDRFTAHLYLNDDTDHYKEFSITKSSLL